MNYSKNETRVNNIPLSTQPPSASAVPSDLAEIMANLNNSSISPGSNGQQMNLGKVDILFIFLLE